MASSPPASQYWCNHCTKYSSTESFLGSLICQDCGHRLSSASPPPPPPPLPPDVDFANLDNDDDFFRIFHLITGPDDDNDNDPPPPSPPSPPPAPFQYDYLRLTIGGWDSPPTQPIQENQETRGNQESQPYSRRRRRGALGGDDLDGARRNRIVRWAESFPGTSQNGVHVRLQLPRADGYFANPGDYVDAEGYEEFLRVLADRDNGGGRGSPPAAKEVVVGLETGVVRADDQVMVCVVCRELVGVGEVVKTLPCRHGYHGDCIVQWLKVRNSCPVCRFELPTDDAEYESERKKKLSGREDVVVDGSASAAPAGVGDSGSGTVENSYDNID